MEPQVSVAWQEVDGDEEGLGSQDQSVPTYWVKKSTLADMLVGEISDKQVGLNFYALHFFKICLYLFSVVDTRTRLCMYRT